MNKEIYKPCSECGDSFLATHNTCKYCKSCGQKVKKILQSKYQKEHYASPFYLLKCCVCNSDISSHRRNKKYCNVCYPKHLQQLKNSYGNKYYKIRSTTKMCATCFTLITNKRSDAMYCKKCSVIQHRENTQTYREKYRKNHPAYAPKKKTLICNKCNKPFTYFHTRASIRIYCNSCRKKLRKTVCHNYFQNKFKAVEFKILRYQRTYMFLILKKYQQGKVHKAGSTNKLLGCSNEEFINHIKSNLKEGMTLENYGRWHLDHIYPVSKFDLTKDEEQLKCFNYKNIMPMWAVDNLIKHNTLPINHQEILASLCHVITKEIKEELKV